MSEAANYYRQAAEHGHVEAKFSLGLSNKKAETNDQKLAALKYFEQAASQGHTESSFIWATALERGYIIDKNDELAAHFLRLLLTMANRSTAKNCSFL